MGTRREVRVKKPSYSQQNGRHLPTERTIQTKRINGGQLEKNITKRNDLKCGRSGNDEEKRGQGGPENELIIMAQRKQKEI